MLPPVNLGQVQAQPVEVTEPPEGPGSCLNNLSCSLYQVEVQGREDGKTSNSGSQTSQGSEAD